MGAVQMNHILKVGGWGYEAKIEALRIYLDTHSYDCVAGALDVNLERAKEMVQIGRRLELHMKKHFKNPFEGVPNIPERLGRLLWAEGCLTRADVRVFLNRYGESLIEVYGVGKTGLSYAYDMAHLNHPLWLNALFDKPLREQIELGL
jgi:hypothetical protein